ncbi:MFS general substrate transporter [Mycena floridula]|nr:MFS general substrate transporter [Mycena floridula]
MTKSESSSASIIATVDEKRLLRKLDLRILPIITLLYLLSFLDRTNIGNAKLAGLTADLHLIGLQYNACAAIFFIPYCFFEVPSNLVLKLFKPARWLAFIMTTWGIIMICMAFVKKYDDLLAARFFLGMSEAGLLPGATFYLSQWYPRRALGQRLALFISASTASGAFGGVLAFGIQHMEGIRGLGGWSWIFLLEGILTVICAVLGLFFLPDYPECTTFLNNDERDWLVSRLKEDAAGLSNKFELSLLWKALGDYKSYLLALNFLFIVIPTYCFALFLPSIINGLGFTAAKAQAMSSPPYILSCIVTMLVGKYSDKTGLRGPFILGINVLGIIGYSVLYATKTPVAGYVASFIACSGLFANIASIISWAASNTGGDVKRSVVLAMVIGLGNLGGIASSFVFRPQDAPRYHLGHATCIGCLCASFVLTAFMSWNYRRLNLLNEEKHKEAPADEKGSNTESGGVTYFKYML